MIRVLVPFHQGGPYLLEIDGNRASLYQADSQGGKKGSGHYTEHNWLPWDKDREKVGIAARLLYQCATQLGASLAHEFAIAAVRAFDEQGNQCKHRNMSMLRS